MSREQVAGIIVIGNEVLSGSVTDVNSLFLSREFRDLGVEVRRVVIIPDDPAEICEQVALFAELFDIVVTTGGVGPTHDDITFACVAAAFGVAMERSAEMERVIRAFFKDQCNDEWLRMAELPVGTELVWAEDLPFPITKVRNVYVLPGEPNVMRSKFGGIRERFRQAPIYTRNVFTTLEEGDISAVLRELEQSSGARIGSYPVYGNDEYKVRVCLEARSLEAVETATERLRAALPADKIVREE